MSNRDFAKNLIDRIPEDKLFYIIAFLQGAAIPNEMPNDETVAAIHELEADGGTKFSGSTQDLFAELLEE